MIEKVVVTRHLGLVDYLVEIGLCDRSTRIIQHATEAEVQNKHVIGVLPFWLAVLAHSVTEIPMDIPSELRGKELSLEQMRMYSGVPQTYQVTLVKPAR